MDAVQLAMEKNLLQDPPAGQQSSGHLYLVIQGTFCDIARYAGTVESSRLIKVAHLCELPRGPLQMQC